MFPNKAYGTARVKHYYYHLEYTLTVMRGLKAAHPPEAICKIILNYAILMHFFYMIMPSLMTRGSTLFSN